MPARKGFIITHLKNPLMGIEQINPRGLLIPQTWRSHLPFPGTKTKAIDCFFPSGHRSKYSIFQLEKYHKAESHPENVNLSIKNVFSDTKQTLEAARIIFSYQKRILFWRIFKFNPYVCVVCVERHIYVYTHTHTYITNYPEAKWLETTNRSCIFGGPGIQGQHIQVALAHGLWLSRNQAVGWGFRHLEAWLGKNQLPNSHRLTYTSSVCGRQPPRWLPTLPSPLECLPLCELPSLQCGLALVTWCQQKEKRGDITSEISMSKDSGFSLVCLLLSNSFPLREAGCHAVSCPVEKPTWFQWDQCI